MPTLLFPPSSRRPESKSEDEGKVGVSAAYSVPRRDKLEVELAAGGRLLDIRVNVFEPTRPLLPILMNTWRTSMFIRNQESTSSY